MNHRALDCDEVPVSEAIVGRHLKEILSAIAQTRQEISDLRSEQEFCRACDELQAVVQSTEQATNIILSASEAANALATSVIKQEQGSGSRAEAEAIQAQMQIIFEACNFQDLTGQRISKVIRTVVFIEERVTEVLRIWSISGRSLGPAPCSASVRIAETSLLNGPALPGAAAVSQKFVDEMFS